MMLISDKAAEVAVGKPHVVKSESERFAAAELVYALLPGPPEAEDEPDLDLHYCLMALVCPICASELKKEIQYVWGGVGEQWKYTCTCGARYTLTLGRRSNG